MIEKILKDNNDLKLDDKIQEEMNIIENIRKSQKRDNPNPSNLIPVHGFKPQIDPRIKNDKNFQEFYSKVEKVNEDKVTDFIKKKHKIHIERKKNRRANFKDLLKSWKNVDKKAEKEKMENYEKMQEKHKKLLEYLRKRQDDLEKKKKGILDQKSYLKNNKKYEEFLKERKEIEDKIKSERSPFNWESIKEREEEIKKLEEKKEKERFKNRIQFKEEMLKNSEKLTQKFQRNEKAFKRVQSLDIKFKGKFTDHFKRSEIQKKYAEKVRERYKPRISEEYKELVEKNKYNAHFGLNLMKKRKEIGLNNITNSKTYLPYSKKIGKLSLEKKHKRNLSQSVEIRGNLTEKGRSSVDLKNGEFDSTMATEQGTLIKSLILNQKERYNLGRSYLMELREINKEKKSNSVFFIEKENSEKDNENSETKTPQIIQYKIQNKTVKRGETFTQEKIKKIEAEINYLDKISKRQNLKIKYHHEDQLKALELEEEADNLLIKSMLAKCVLNDCKVEGKVIKEFKVPEKQYPKPKSPINYKKAKYRLVKKKNGNNGGDEIKKEKSDKNHEFGNSESNMEENGEYEENNSEKVNEEDLFDDDPFGKDF